MTVRLTPILSCDRAGCEQRLWRPDEFSVRTIRGLAARHGWVLRNGKDWCHTHAAELDVTPAGSDS